MYKEFSLKNFVDEKGSLCPVDFESYELFEVKRVYAVYRNKMLRGGHAHLKEEEFFFMAEGSCKCKIHNGEEWIDVELEVGKNGLYVGNMIWHQFDNFSDGASLVALSSTSYNPNREDYVEDFNDFLKRFNKNV